MASKKPTTEVRDKEPDADVSTLSSRFQASAKITSSALVPVSHETQVQKYTKGDEPAHDPKPAKTSTAPVSVVVEHHDAVRRQTAAAAATTTKSFFSWQEFETIQLPARKESFKKSRRDKILAPLSKFKIELPGEVGVEGFDGLLGTAHNILSSNIHLDFMETERSILLPANPSPSTSKPEPPSQKELERLEIELFNISRFVGDSEFLTAVTWTEDGETETGSITLYRVEFDEQEMAMGIQPVAAMQDVPNPILVGMRTHEKIKKKAVFVPTDDDDVAQGSFKWTANRSRVPKYLTALKLDEDTKDKGAGSTSPGRHRDRDSSRSPSRGPKLADGNGVYATIPQFVALMHANRSILEEIHSSHVSQVETEDGRRVSAVHLHKLPRANSHAGSEVHVAVLIPSQAEWAEERIFWTDKDGLAEFRRRKYWDLIERDRRRGSRSRSRHSGHSGHSHSHSRSRHASPDGGERGHSSRSRSPSRHHLSGHSESRSRSRHLSLHSLFGSSEKGGRKDD